MLLALALWASFALYARCCQPQQGVFVVGSTDRDPGSDLAIYALLRGAQSEVRVGVNASFPQHVLGL